MEEVKNRTSENTYRRRVDVIIPTYKPGKKFSWAVMSRCSTSW